MKACAKLINNNVADLMFFYIFVLKAITMYIPIRKSRGKGQQVKNGLKMCLCIIVRECISGSDHDYSKIQHVVPLESSMSSI